MTGSQIYEFHQRELDDLKTASVFTLGVCGWIKRLQEGIARDEPTWAANAIHEFLDFNSCRESCLDPIDHLLAHVAQPFTIPGSKSIRGRSDNAKTDVLNFKLAHRAAWRLHYFIHNHLWTIWSKRHHGQLGSRAHAFEASHELVESAWQDLRLEFKALVTFDSEGLREAVEKETVAAMERCRMSIVANGGNAPVMVPDIPPMPPLNQFTPTQRRVIEAAWELADWEAKPYPIVNAEKLARCVWEDEEKVSTALRPTLSKLCNRALELSIELTMRMATPNVEIDYTN